MKNTFLYALATILLLSGAHQAMAQDAPKPKGAMFDKLDTDGDGTVSKEEFEAKKAEHMKKKRDDMLKKLDSNGDGDVSEDEFIAQSRERFKKLDANSDGKITKEEAEEHRETMRKKWKERSEKDKTAE